MKWLYRIFRLFRCPHKFKAIEWFKMNHNATGNQIGQVTILKCLRCGRQTEQRITI